MNRYRAVYITVLFFILTGFLSAMNWPSETAVMIRNFGSNDRGKPSLGMVFAGNTQVLAAETGEVIFTHNKNDTFSRLPSPFGAWTAVDHEDGLITIYSRYADSTSDDSLSSAPDSEKSVTPVRVQKQEPIAVSGISGWSAQNGFYFQVYDRRERSWINPAMLVTPQKETRPPQILSVELLNAQGLRVQSWNLSQGRYTVVVNSNIASAARGSFFAPQRIVCSINGAEAGSLNFESFSARDGVLMVFRNGLVPARQVYSNFPAFEAATVFLSRGQANLEVIVQDINGNSRSYVSRIVVN
jgi:murein DD-endopeptidase MepM/ murein hydrolase activator NlpD